MDWIFGTGRGIFFVTTPRMALGLIRPSYLVGVSFHGGKVVGACIN